MMKEYKAPGVYVEDSPLSIFNGEPSGFSTAGFVGITQRGAHLEPILLNSWNDFVNKFAFGMDSPFISASHLALSVYGYFLNGGQNCYVVRAVSETAAQAVTASPVVKAIEVGTWGNNLSLVVDTAGTNFNVKVKLGANVVEEYPDVSNTAEDPKYWVTYINNRSKYIVAVSGNLAESASVAFTSGVDGVTDIADADFKKALETLDSINNLNYVSCPGQVSVDMSNIVIGYATNRGDCIAILDTAQSADVADAVTFRGNLDDGKASLYYPWLKIKHPVTKAITSCPTCGYIAGVYSRIARTRGFWKSPAGIETTIMGVVSLENSNITFSGYENLNFNNVNALSVKNTGIVIWGARSLSSEMPYVSDILTNHSIKGAIYELTQQFVFEPNGEALWAKVGATIEAYLDSLWLEGALQGKISQEAYFVKCDGDLNTQQSVEDGHLVCEVGYAPKFPTEFVVFQVRHNLNV
jgi:phage tail sheath protein FI